MADEESAGRDPVAETRKADIYLASVAEEQIRSFEGLMSASDCNTFARNMSALLDRAKAEKKVKKGDVVVKANVRPGTTTAVNVLNSYCLLPETKSKRNAKARLHRHPLNYLKLALAAAELAGWPRHKAIMLLTEGSNAFSGRPEIDMEKFTPAEAVWQLLRTKLSVLVKKHCLREFFRAAQELSAVYEYDWAKMATGWRRMSTGTGRPRIGHLCA